MKRFLVFSGPDYECGGGMNDFDNSYDSFEDALVAIGQVSEGWFAHILDLEQDKVIGVSEGEWSFLISSTGERERVK